MDERAEKLAKARKKLKDHQVKKTLPNQRSERGDQLSESNIKEESVNNNINAADTIITNIENQCSPVNGITAESQINQDASKPDINFTELLISNKTNLEMQINDLNAKLAQLEYQLGLEVCNHNLSKQNIVALQSEVNDLRNKYSSALQETSVKDDNILRLENTNKTLQDDNADLLEQLEFAKSILTSKEFENAQVQNQIFSYQSQLDQLQLQLQQLTNNSTVMLHQERNTQEVNASLQKIPILEQKIEALQKEKDHIQSHYEHYVQELNEQVQSEIVKNETLNRNLQDLYNRENSLIEQISDMEIRLQNYDIKNKTVVTQTVDVDSEKKYMELKNQLEESNKKYEELQGKYTESLNKIQVLTQEIEKASHFESTCNHGNVDISKLTADMTSDKLAAQRATEQNNKLKADIEQLQQVIVKMGKDKLELTEKWTHLNQLSKGLSLRLAELEEHSKMVHNLFRAKDDEMIRMQGEHRELKHKYEKLLQETNQVTETSELSADTECNHDIIDKNNENDAQHIHENCEHAETIPLIPETVCQKMKKDALNDTRIQKEDAMVKLQERFLNIMDEVANLSDEKHRLEHIILQLQTETDTICEYVALYQQQRSLLKRREEERSKQLEIFQNECDKLKRHLEELNHLLLSIAADEQLASLLKEESRHNDLVRVKELLQKLQNCPLINPKFKNLDLDVFYPCSCCSGQLIDV